jgi:methionine synthase reductase
MKISILYGSQTGNAKEMAYVLQDFLQDTFTNSQIILNEMNGYVDKMEELNTYDYVLFICSTTGNGDFPENASLFWRKIKNRSISKNTFTSLKFSVCALGDSNYSMFCNSCKNLHKRITELGGISIIPLYCMDAVYDDEEQFDNYTSQISTILHH